MIKHNRIWESKLVLAKPMTKQLHTQRPRCIGRLEILSSAKTMKAVLQRSILAKQSKRWKRKVQKKSILSVRLKANSSNATRKLKKLRLRLNSKEHILSKPKRQLK